MSAPSTATSGSVADDPLDGRSVAVVGGGIGGLSAACYLARDGADVTVLERHDRLGGVAGRIERDGYAFDTGPSWYLQPDVYERFFGHFGREPGEFYDLTELDPKYRVFWYDETDADTDTDTDTDDGPTDRVSVPADREGVRELFESYEQGAGDALSEYLAGAREAYELGMERFVYEDRARLRDMLDLDVARSGRALPLLRSMDDHVERHVSHPKLKQLLEYTLVFLGGSPYNTPALYSMLSWADHGLGVYHPEGGMYSVVRALRELGASLGVDYHTGTEVERVEGERDGFTLRTATGDRHADLVVCNVPPAAADRHLLPEGERVRGPDAWDDATFAPSAYMLYLGVEGDVDPLAHHSLVFPSEWDDHFEAIFDDPAWPDAPAYYLSVPSLTDDTLAPAGGHTVVVLVPIAPGLPDGPDARRRYRATVLDRLAADTGVDLRGRIAVEAEACVSEFAGRFDRPGGTALGLAHTLRQTGPLRPAHRAGPDGVYFVGSDTTPGIGVSMCLVSGEHTATAVREDERKRERERGLLSLPFG
jgi:phytoene desaturase